MIRARTIALLTTLTAGCWPDHGKDETGGTGGTDGTTSTGAPDTTGPDAGSSSAGAQTTDPGSTGAATTTTTTGAETTGGAPLCADNDEFEPNDLPESPALVPWDEVSQYAAHVTFDSFLCSGESDWYRVDVASLDYRFYALHLDGLVAGTSWCGMPCDDPWLPDAPENTLALDVHDAETLELLGGQVATDGRVDLGGSGVAYSKDLLIHVHAAPPEATYAYALAIEIRGYDGEDECEC